MISEFEDGYIPRIGNIDSKYKGQIVNLKNFKGEIRITDNIFDHNIVRY
jgi:hypothetical protein